MKITLAVTGSIAAYKACLIVRALKKEGHDVQVIMTDGARGFVTAQTFEALSDNPVPNSNAATDLYQHLDVGKCDVFLVAPATANIIAQMRSGAANNIVSCAYLGTDAKVIVAPAMNVRMWEHVATQENIKALIARDVVIIPPKSGLLACGDIGDGRLASVADIVATVKKFELL